MSSRSNLTGLAFTVWGAAMGDRGDWLQRPRGPTESQCPLLARNMRCSISHGLQEVPGCLAAARGLGNAPVHHQVLHLNPNHLRLSIQSLPLQGSECPGCDPLVRPVSDYGGRTSGVGDFPIAALAPGPTPACRRPPDRAGVAGSIPTGGMLHRKLSL